MTFEFYRNFANQTEGWLRDEQRPYALSIVVHLERGSDVTHEETLLAAAYGVRDFMLSEEIRPEGAWHAATSEWMTGRIRKVARRARGAAWDKVTALPGVVSSFDDAVVYVLPPHPVDEIPMDISKLQVQGLDLPRNPDKSPLFQSGIRIALNPEISMTTGKAIAQVGHAIQLALLSADEETLKGFELFRPNISLVPFDMYKDWDIVVHDAGFTEVEAGSLTAVSKIVTD